MSISHSTFFLLVIIALLAITGLWAGPPLEGLWRLPVALLVLLIAMEYSLAAGKLSMQREVKPVIQLGETSDYQLNILNASHAPVTVEFQPAYPDQLSGDTCIQRSRINAQDKQSHRLPLTPTTLGPVSLGRIYYKQRGRFGLCWWHFNQDDQCRFKVEPAHLNHNNGMHGLSESGHRSNLRTQGSGIDLLELREYRPGDPVKNIAWKATAKRGQPVVRHFEREQHLEVVVLIDCGLSSRNQCGALNRFHHYVNVAARFSELASIQGDRIASIGYAQQIINMTPIATGAKASMAIRHMLSSLHVHNETSNALNAALDIKRLLKHRGLIIFLTDIEHIDASSQLAQAARLLSRKHKMLVATLEEPSIDDILDTPVNRTLDSYQQLAALEYKRSRQLSQDHLIRQGVTIVRAPAEHLDQRVMHYYQQHRGIIGSA